MKLTQLQSGDFFKRLGETFSEVLYKQKVKPEEPYQSAEYALKEYPLDKARDKVLLEDFPEGSYIYIYKLGDDIVASLQVNRDDAPKILLNQNDEFRFKLGNPLHRLYLTNPASPGETLIFFVSTGLFEFNRRFIAIIETA